MRLHDLRPAEGSRHRRKRLGRGESSGLGKTSGKGHKGQKARAGAAIRPGFEGGQMPLHRRLPKKGFSNAAFKTIYEIVNVGSLEKKFEAGSEVTREALIQAGLIRGKRGIGVKILGNGDLNIKVSVKADKFSESAKAKIEAAGGTVELLS